MDLSICRQGKEKSAPVLALPATATNMALNRSSEPKSIEERIPPRLAPTLDLWDSSCPWTFWLRNPSPACRGLNMSWSLKNLRAFLCLFQAQSMSPDQVMSAGHDSNPLGKIPHNPFLPWRSRLRYIVGDSIEAYVVILSHNIGENSRMYWTKKTFDGRIRKWTAKLSTFFLWVHTLVSICVVSVPVFL